MLRPMMMPMSELYKAQSIISWCPVSQLRYYRRNQRIENRTFASYLRYVELFCIIKRCNIVIVKQDITKLCSVLCIIPTMVSSSISAFIVKRVWIKSILFHPRNGIQRERLKTVVTKCWDDWLFSNSYNLSNKS